MAGDSFLLLSVALRRAPKERSRDYVEQGAREEVPGLRVSPSITLRRLPLNPKPSKKRTRQTHIQSERQHREDEREDRCNSVLLVRTRCITQDTHAMRTDPIKLLSASLK